MSKEQKESNNEKRQFWQMAIKTWRDSGMSVSKFCKAEGLVEGTFYNWLKKLTDGQSQTNKQKGLNSSAFIELAMSKNNPVALELVLSSGNTLRIGFGVDTKTLSGVLSVLRQVGLC